ncbi:MAG: DedA family protein [Bacteroidales bacterium]|nr:DedA family protein [Bacteroidales bacterium]
MKRFCTIFLLLCIGLNCLADVDTTTTDNTSLFSKVESWYSQNMNYVTVTTLMTIESSFIPFPSEIVIPPAAYVACNDDNDMNIILIVLFGTLGSLLGALINYFLSLWLGRPIIYKFADSKLGHLLLLSGEKVQKAESYFNEYGKVSTFIGRLIPAVRQLISIPAGLSRMKLPTFVAFTALGAGIWNAVLAALGYFAHGQQDLINKYSHELGYAILIIVCMVLIFVGIRYVKKKRQ